MSGPLPSSQQPITTVNNGVGFITPVWQRWLQSLLSGALPAAPITLAVSPTSFTAPAQGSLVVVGGTVSSITITRGAVAVPTGLTSGIIPLSLNDIATITYTVAPTVTFLPT